MANLYYNGLHWCSPVDNSRWQTPQPQYNAGQGFSSAFVVAGANMGPYFGGQTFQNRWQDVCGWINTSGDRPNETVLRLFWGSGQTLAGDPGPTLGQDFYYHIVKPAVQNYGIRNFQVLNELNIEYESAGYSRSKLGGDMVNIAYRIKQLAASEGIGPIYLGFPGPGGTPDKLQGAVWEQYWLDYLPYIKWNTPWGYAYNWLAPHTYEFSSQGLYNVMSYQYWWLNANVGELPLRFTEYGIPIESIPNQDRYSRANGYRQAILNLKNYAAGKPWVDIYGVYCYLAYNSDAGSQDGADGRYELVISNSDLSPASHLAGAF